MRHYADEWIEEWCQENGWTDLFMERYNHYWAFPPGAVMPEPIPQHTLHLIKASKGLSLDERRWSSLAICVTILAMISSYVFQCPVPLVVAFGFAAITVAKLEME